MLSQPHGTEFSQHKTSPITTLNSQETDDNHANISNEMNITVLFPDKTDNIPTSGSFQNQEEFRKFLLQNPGKRVRHALHTRPKGTRSKDYSSDEFVKAFPLQFPYGYAGFKSQEVMKQFFKFRNSSIDDNDLLRHFLRHRKREFHKADFNLVANGVLMKSRVFNKVRLQCNLRFKDAKQLSEKFGEMTGAAINNSVIKARQEIKLTPHTDPADQFLRSVTAVCDELPHSNEAAVKARDRYFSLIVRFGLPALFVTVSPDDQRSAWIRIYLLRDQNQFWGKEPDVDSLKNEDIIAEYKQRKADRTEFPGLCAEDYIAITEIFIRQVLKWDRKWETNLGEGLFGSTEAFTQATEEQGRKTLHGHFLVWIENWNELLHRVMGREGTVGDQRQDLMLLRKYVQHVSSATIFEDFEPTGVLKETPPFFHESCRSKRMEGVSRFSVEAVPDSQLNEMRKADKCHEYKGHIATCPNCSTKLTVNHVVQTCLNGCTDSHKFEYPDQKRRRLDRLVYEMQKDYSWHRPSPQKQAIQKFAANSLSNVHNVTHSPRCFKKGCVCYTKIPVNTLEKFSVNFAEEPTMWANYDGTKQNKWLFEARNRRPLQDVFTNIHNLILTLLFLCNNNVLVALTGAAILYVTSYSSKKTQKDEREAFENMSKVLIGVVEKQVSFCIGSGDFWLGLALCDFVYIVSAGFLGKSSLSFGFRRNLT